MDNEDNKANKANKDNKDKKTNNDKKVTQKGAKEQTKLNNYKCSGYSSTNTLHPYLTKAARKDLDKIFWINY